VKVSDAIPKGWAGFIAPDAPRLGLGLDLATTTKKKSNPSALALTQEIAPLYFVRLLLSWKTADPNVTREILRLVLNGLPFSYHATRLCIDATSERFFAADLRDEFSGIVPVELVVASEATEYMGERMSFKQYTGNLLVNTFDDSHLAIPKEQFIQTDMRLVVRDRGTFDAEVDEDGRHGDTFDAVKLSLHALISKSGPAEAAAAPVGDYGRNSIPPLERFPLRPDHSSDRGERPTTLA
jgi:hypothetical protein